MSSPSSPNSDERYADADSSEVLKSDLFGHIRKENRMHSDKLVVAIVRDTDTAKFWVKPIARMLAAREARALKKLPAKHGLPSLLDWNGRQLVRSFVDGEPMQRIKPRSAEYFISARSLLRALHKAGVVHNDTAKEPNWLVLPDGNAGLVDFQLAGHFVTRTKLFRTLAREDIRHLLKHKRSYCPDKLSTREHSILATPATHSRVWKNTGKRIYVFVTRKIFKWQDREGANDRKFDP